MTECPSTYLRTRRGTDRSLIGGGNFLSKNLLLLKLFWWYSFRSNSILLTATTIVSSSINRWWHTTIDTCTAYVVFVAGIGGVQRQH